MSVFLFTPLLFVLHFKHMIHMNPKQSGFIPAKISVLVVVIVLLAIVLGVFIYKDNMVDDGPVSLNLPIENSENKIPEDTMTINLYIQDKEVARVRDCSATLKVSYTIPKTVAVADASLKILFGNEQSVGKAGYGELARYGVYKSVSISNGVAKVMLESAMTPAGKPIGSLSSCESGHLLSVITDTLTQYESVKSVELYSPEGKIEF